METNGYKLFLSGGGDLNDVKEFDDLFYRELSFGDSILYLPIALGRNTHGYEQCYDWYSSAVSMHGEDKDLDFTMLLEKDDISDLSRFSAIYIGGGNTFRLLDYFMKSGFLQQLQKFLESGGIVYGGSAGAIVFGNSINTVIEESDMNFKYSDGLNLVRDASIVCHYNSNMDFKINRRLGLVKSPIIALPENAGLIITPERITPFNDVYLFGKRNSQVFKEKITESF